MDKTPESRLPYSLLITFEFLKVVLFLYGFLISITLMGAAFKAHKQVAETLIVATNNPFIGLVIGIVVTSLIQSSSTTTSIIVTMVGAGTLPLTNAIPMVMGANIGTTVTNTIVSFGYAGRRTEFERSFGASIVHDMFNIYATCILFPLEIYFHFIEISATKLETIFEGFGGLDFVSPLKVLVNPVADPIANFLPNPYLLLIVALAGLFYTMKGIVDNMRGIVMEKVENVLNIYLFRNAAISLLFGMIFTAIVQSSSIATSILIPIVGAGLLSIEQIFPYTLGANIGTTITAMLAALTIAMPAALTVALAHLLFNIFGILIIYPIKIVPIWTARTIAAYVSRSKKHFIIFAGIYILLHVVPIVFAFIHG